jgi:hypothetical protein
VHASSLAAVAEFAGEGRMKDVDAALISELSASRTRWVPTGTTSLGRRG